MGRVTQPPARPTLTALPLCFPPHSSCAKPTFLFSNLQTAFFATPFLSYSCELPRGVVVGITTENTSLPTNEDQNDTNHHHFRPGPIPPRRQRQGPRPLHFPLPNRSRGRNQALNPPTSASGTPKTWNPAIPTTSPQTSSRSSPKANSPHFRRPSRSVTSWLGWWSSLPRAASPLAAPPSSPTPAASSSAAPSSSTKIRCPQSLMLSVQIAPTTTNPVSSRILPCLKRSATMTLPSSPAARAWRGCAICSILNSPLSLPPCRPNEGGSRIKRLRSDEETCHGYG
jgi:hypothetical protein